MTYSTVLHEVEHICSPPHTPPVPPALEQSVRGGGLSGVGWTVGSGEEKSKNRKRKALSSVLTMTFWGRSPPVVWFVVSSMEALRGPLQSTS